MGDFFFQIVVSLDWPNDDDDDNSYKLFMHASCLPIDTKSLKTYNLNYTTGFI